MEEVYFQGPEGRPKPASWCSKKVTFKTYFSRYSQELKSAVKENGCTVSEIFNSILPENKEFSEKDVEALLEISDATKHFNKSFKLKSIPSSFDLNLPSTSEKGLFSNPKAGCSSSSGLDDCPNSSRKEATDITNRLNTYDEQRVSNTGNLNPPVTIKKKKRNKNTLVSVTDLKEKVMPEAADCLDSSQCVEKSSDLGNSLESVEVLAQMLKQPKITSPKNLSSYPCVLNKLQSNITSLDVIDCQVMDDSNSNTLIDQEITDMNQIPVRRSTRKKNNTKAKEAHNKDIDKKNNTKAEEALNKDIDYDKSLVELKIEEELDLIDKCLSLPDEFNKIKMRSGKNRQRNLVRGGQVIVDTTKRRGKKDLLPRQNFVISFRVYKPFKHVIGDKSRASKCGQEIEVLNYQTLADLRAAIWCEGDYQDVCGDVSDNLNRPFEHLAMNKYKSGMFYFGNTFYVDTKPGAEDFSEDIREWARLRGIQLGGTVPMNEMIVENLEVRLGYPYVYKHQGSCEHLIVISNARLLAPEDSLHSTDYPNLTKLSRSSLVYCGICLQKPAKWIVSDSDRMLHDFNMMCDSCIRSYHYIGNKKIGNFKAHRWMQRAILFA